MARSLLCRTTLYKARASAPKSLVVDYCCTCTTTTDRSVCCSQGCRRSGQTSMIRGQHGSMQPQEREQREHRCRSKTFNSYYSAALACLMATAAAIVPQAEGQQMDPAAMQRQIQQQMGGSPGGGGAPPPNRIGESKDVEPFLGQICSLCCETAEPQQ